MVKGQSKGRVPVSEAVISRSVDEKRSILCQLFGRLHEQFREPVPQPVEPLHGPSPSSDFWEDAFYCYLEIDLTGFSVSELDISVTNGRAYIRVGR